jgi:hypothetical protein
VAAAGNGGDNVPLYPAALDGVIAVGATNDLDQRASFSTWGDWIDLAAPGQMIWSAVQTNYQWDVLTQMLFMLSFGWDGVNPYMYSDGTSMACPLVAGVCGLVRSVRPDFTPEQVRARLVSTGEALVFDHPIGVKVDARAALDGLAASAVGDLPAVTRFDRIAPNPFNPMTRIDYYVGKPGRVKLVVYDLRGRRVRTLVDREHSSGEHTTEWNGRDEVGRIVASGTYSVQLAAGEVQWVWHVTLVK